MIRARRLGHVVLSVRDVKKSIEFYTRALGLEIAAYQPERGTAFLSMGEDHHELALFQRAAPDAKTPDDTQPGIHHIAWQVEDFPALQAAWRELGEAGIAVECTIEHNVTRSVYFHDPDGNRVELYCDRWEDGREAMRTMRLSVAPLDMETGAVGAPDERGKDEPPAHLKPLGAATNSRETGEVGR